MMIKFSDRQGVTIAQWIRLRLPSCCPAFKSKAHHQCFYLVKFYSIFVITLRNKIKRGRVWPIFKNLKDADDDLVQLFVNALEKRTKMNKKRPDLAHNYKLTSLKLFPAPAHEHHVIALHRHGNKLGGLPTIFWFSVGFLILIFHLFLFKLIWQEYCAGQDKFRTR